MIKRVFKENDQERIKSSLLWDSSKCVIRGLCIEEERRYKKELIGGKEKDMKELLELQKKLQNRYSKKLEKQIRRQREKLDEINNLLVWKKQALIKMISKGRQFKQGKDLYPT